VVEESPRWIHYLDSDLRLGRKNLYNCRRAVPSSVELWQYRLRCRAYQSVQPVCLQYTGSTDSRSPGRRGFPRLQSKCHRVWVGQSDSWVWMVVVAPQEHWCSPYPTAEVYQLPSRCFPFYHFSDDLRSWPRTGQHLSRKSNPITRRKLGRLKVLRTVGQILWYRWIYHHL